MSTYEFFSDEELTCQCGCGQMEMDAQFMREVVEGRRALGFPFIVTSAYRCPEHNNSVSNSGYNGAHTLGRALDIKADARRKALVMNYFKGVGMTRFGVARTFIHFDDLTEQDLFDEDVVWTY
jgi:zinc D-Ala-D-Ala carboxypeptidase